MTITVEPLRVEDAGAMVAAEDEETIRRLTGGRSTIEGTREYVRRLAENALAGSTKRAFTIRVDGECVGSIDHDADPQDGIGPGDVNIAYVLAPWLRGRGITARAVELLCAELSRRGAGERAVIRCEADNLASVRVAEKAGFAYVRDVLGTSEDDERSSPVRHRVYVRAL
ncbi:GNAT family N-acetyltransferase [Brachybacterium sacelli]|uniref:RimJ/RimL family protein N-acetyltransferase n=2 Tax=Brachybacterium sacelli TaxID=173364 RepID=A0ABS4X2P1_9MICO|nr:GNAT family N-acetyltransferase [Brachybacterium sacelli]MBP2382715.1 RimJ/RimL family protein N-acetyltransferase [Brachybacterium sacelli]